MKKRFFVLAAMLLMMFSLTVPVFATEGVRTENAVNGGSTGTDAPYDFHEGGISDNVVDTNTSSNKPSISDKVDQVTNELINTDITTQDIVDRLNNKGNDIVMFLQTVGRYVCFAGFVICCILAVIGICGNKRLLAGACIGLVVSGVAYAGIVCGREIVTWIAAWATS